MCVSNRFIHAKKKHYSIQEEHDHKKQQYVYTENNIIDPIKMKETQKCVF